MRQMPAKECKNWAVRLVLLIIGLFIAHFGVVLFVLGDGTDTFTIFVQGVSNVAGLSIGTCQVIILTVMMVLMALFTKGYVKLNDLRILRWMADRSVHVASGWCAQSPMAIRIGAMVVGCVIIALGKAVVIMTDAGSGPMTCSH
ncbi:MAG: hypothetical protein ACLVJO_02720 [[Clostridium] scindens]